MYGGVFQNFLRGELNAGPFDLGRLESLREVPGLLAALTAGSLTALAEAHIAGIGLMMTGIGIGLSGYMGGYWPLVGITVFWSIGFHLYSTMSGAITLALAKGREGGRHLARTSAWGSMATLAALGAATGVSQLWRPHYNAYFIAGGVCIFIAGLICWKLSTHASGDAGRARLIIRREYGLYYLLIFLEGCRRQIFSIFASFALILVYKVPLERMLLLQFLNAALISATAPMIGRWIDRTGERRTLSFYALGLIVVFIGYAVADSVGVLYALFLLDNVLFTFSVGFTTYLHRIVRPGELTPCLAMGVTMNHIAAVSVPITGAWLWYRYHDYRLPFMVGVFVAVVSLIAVRWLPSRANDTA